MHQYRMKLADVPLLINCFYSSTESYCRDFLYEGDYKYEISISEEDIRFEREIETLETSEQYLETLAVFRKVAEELIEDNVVVFHSSTIEIDGDAYVFAAPSGTGKSTHTRMWRELFADKDIHMINDDKPLLKIDSDIIAYGTPWKGKSKLGENRSAQVKGICFLKQGRVNDIHRINKEKAVPRLFRQVYRIPNRNKLAKTMTLLNKLPESVPIYEMSCTISYEAAKIAYEYMSGGFINETEKRVCDNCG